MSGYDIGLDRKKNDPLNIMLDYMFRDSTVLEFGCANGRMTRYMSGQMGCMVDVVEYDQELLEKAMAFARDGICGDICEFGWCEKFKNRKYDYIIFADVLEHLPNPREVLEKCKVFLKKTGLIWISVPNISHNDIIIQLLRDKFEYTETGLLDKTHVHFFTASSAKEMFQKIGYCVAYEDAICVHTFCTEQLLSIDTGWRELYQELLQREKGEAYQCVFALSLSGEDVYVGKNFTYWNRQCNLYEERVYFDTGNGFQEGQYTWKSGDNHNLHIEIDIPPNTKMVWICPAFRRRYLIRNMEILADSEKVDYCKINAKRHENDFFFDSIDGAIYVDRVIGISKLIISGQILLDVAFERKAREDEIQEERLKLEECETEREAIEGRLNALKDKVRELESQNEIILKNTHTQELKWQTEINSKNTEIDNKNIEIMRLNEEIWEMKENAIDDKKHIDELISQIERIKSTKIWKLYIWIKGKDNEKS